MKDLEELAKRIDLGIRHLPKCPTLNDILELKRFEFAKENITLYEEFDYFQAHRPKPELLKHYFQVQRPWVAESIYLLEKRLGHKPSMLEEATDYRDKNAARFRVYYALRYPNNVEIGGNCGQRAS